MTVRLYGHSDYALILPVGCEPCGSSQRMVLRRMGSIVGQVIHCPCCTRDGVSELLASLPVEALSPTGGGDVA